MLSLRWRPLAAFFVATMPFAAATAPMATLRQAWTAIVADMLEKYVASQPLAEICPSVSACLEAAALIPTEEALALTPPQLLQRLQTHGGDTSTAGKAFAWLHGKYGILDQPLFVAAIQSSYRTPGNVRFRFEAPVLPGLFDPNAPSSIQDIHRYVERKWGGLQHIAHPDHIIFSELGTQDTLTGLAREGYTDFQQINAPYSLRGSKALLAFHAGDPQPTLVFHSFVSRDLLVHKLMQLSYQFGEELPRMRLLTSNNLKSWEVADAVVTRALRALPARPIDDLVIGYADVIEGQLRQRGRFLQEARVGDFATVRYYEITGKSGLTRTVAVLTDVELRYFGNSALTLVRPFLHRGIDRVIFAGSAGCFDRAVPVHSLSIPRTFHELTDDGAVGPPLSIANDLYGLLPHGTGHAGPHLSVLSPLVETQLLVRRLREQDHMLTVDVEGAKIARLIARHNDRHGTRIRFASAFIVTDTPTAAGDTDTRTDYGLHRPDFNAKKEAKRLYAAALNLLWEMPDRFTPSNHTRLVTGFYAGEIRRAVTDGNTVQAAVMSADIEERLRVVREFESRDLRVSSGIARGYEDLLRELEREGVTALRAEEFHEPRAVVALPVLPVAQQRMMMMQSLSRSSTLSSGDTHYDSGASQAETRHRATANAEAAVAFVLASTHRPLDGAYLQELHTILNRGILPADALGAVQSFTYHPVDGAPVTSEEAVSRFLHWLGTTPLTAETALEAFLGFEHIHPFKDGNGRVAELLAQSVMLRAVQHPLLFPHRFDIDYILSLRRNGSYPGALSQYLHGLIEDSQRFGSWLQGSAARDGDLIRTVFQSSHRFRLERESREFLAPVGEPALLPLKDSRFDTVAAGSLSMERRQYRVTYNLHRRRALALLPADCASFLTP